jgi:hypothetical protein
VGLKFTRGLRSTLSNNNNNNKYNYFLHSSARPSVACSETTSCVSCDKRRECKNEASEKNKCSSVEGKRFMNGGEEKDEEQQENGGCDLHKVGHGRAGGHHALVIGDGVENLEVAVEILVELEDGGDVSAPVAVVGSRPHCDEVLLGEHVLVTLLHELMRSADELQAVDSREL